MASFFGQLQSLLENKSSGRFLAQLLKVMVEHDPYPIKAFLRHTFPGPIKGFPRLLMTSKLTAECEAPLHGVDGSGRMDVTIFANQVPYVRIEIKFDDKLSEQESGDQLQLKKYINWCQQEPCHLLILTKNPLNQTDYELVEKNRPRVEHRFHADIGQFLEQAKSLPSKLLLDYLRDKGLVMNKINIPLLYSLLHRFLNPWNGAGKVATSRLREAPAQLTALLQNMALLADDITPKINRGPAAKNHRATIDFSVSPYYATSGVKSVLKNNPTDEEVAIESRYRRGGVVWVSARHSLGTARNWLNIDYGFWIEVKSSKGKDLEFGQYASIGGMEIRKNRSKNADESEVTVEGRGNISKLVADMENKKGELVKRFGGLLAKALEKEQKLGLVTTSSYKKKLSKTLELLRA